MKKNLALRINNRKEADFCGQILKEVDLCFHDHLPFNDTVSRNYLLVENGHFYFSYENIVKNGDITLVNSWREFVLNYLGNFSYLCRDKEEKEKLIDIICENGLNEKNNFRSPINMEYCYLEEWRDSLVFNDTKPENKQEITLDNLLLLINSVRRFDESSHSKTMKTENKTNNKNINNTVIHLKDKKEKAAAKVYLEGFFRENNLDIGFCKEAFNYSNSSCIYFRINDQYAKVVSWYSRHKQKSYTNILSFAELEEFAQLIKEGKKKAKSFAFQNGLVAKYNEDNNDNIIIGCKEKNWGFWRNLVDDLIPLDEGFSISSYSFTVSEIKEFKKWLENL